MAIGTKIGRLSICIFENWMCSTGKPIYKFSFGFVRRGISFQILKWVTRIELTWKPKWKTGKPISIEEFATKMKRSGVDLTKSKTVEISVNGISEINL